MDSYEILGISRDDSIAKIKETFRKKAKECHPDIGGDVNTFIQLKEAYEKIIKEKEIQPDLTNAMADLLNHHHLLNRFFTLFNDDIHGNKHHWTL